MSLHFPCFSLFSCILTSAHLSFPFCLYHQSLSVFFHLIIPFPLPFSISSITSTHLSLSLPLFPSQSLFWPPPHFTTFFFFFFFSFSFSSWGRAPNSALSPLIFLLILLSFSPFCSTFSPFLPPAISPHLVVYPSRWLLELTPTILQPSNFRSRPFCLAVS